MGDRYHYELLQPHVEGEDEQLFVDWGSDVAFQPQIGVGECAGVVIDLVSTLLLEAEEKLGLAEEALEEGREGHAMYHAYAAQIAGAKALLVQEGEATNTYAKIMDSFDLKFVATDKIHIASGSFSAQVMAYVGPSRADGFAQAYVQVAAEFLASLRTFHQSHPTSKAS